MEKLTFEEWKALVIANIKAAGYQPKLEDDDMLFIAYDMEELTPEEAAAQYVETKKQNEE